MRVNTIPKRYVVLLGAAMAAAAASGVLVAGGAANPPVAASSRGVPVPPGKLVASDAKTLAALQANSGLSEIRAVEAARFARFVSARHGTCFAVGRGPERLGAVLCDATFPSIERPVLDASLLVRNDLMETAQLVMLQGFAADNVSVLRVTTSTGAEADVRVVNNAYYLRDVPPGEPSTLVAYDRDGRVVYRQSLGNEN